MRVQEQDWTIEQGETFQRIVRWETLPLIYKPITAITKAAPVAITAVGHGLPDGWRATVASAGGMRQINAQNWPPRPTDFHRVTVSDVNTVTMNEVNSASYTAYTSGGSLVYYTPVDLVGYTARMQIRTSPSSTDTLLAITSADAQPLSGITLDNTAKTITLFISATDTAALDFSSAVYDLELESADGVVTRILKGNVLLDPEVTQ